jgi:hypothetical protein
MEDFEVRMTDLEQWLRPVDRPVDITQPPAGLIVVGEHPIELTT